MIKDRGILLTMYGYCWEKIDVGHWLKGLRLVSGTDGVRGGGGGTFDCVKIKHWNCKHSS